LLKNDQVQDATTPLLETLRSILESTVERLSNTTTQFENPEDARDGFSTMRISTESSQAIIPTSPPSSLRSVTDTCVTALATLPMLHSREPTRDKKFTDWIANANPESLFAALPSWMNSVRELTFTVSTSALASIFARFDELLRTYNYRYNDVVRILVTRLLQFTLPIWIDHTTAISEARELAQKLADRLLKASRDHPSWRNRDAILNFLGEYVMRDPTYSTWLPGLDILPHKLVTEFGANDDIRVRFRAATASARLLYYVDPASLVPIKLYNIIRESLSIEVDK
jgi:serine-protein kinase ATM